MIDPAAHYAIQHYTLPPYFLLLLCFVLSIFIVILCNMSGPESTSNGGYEYRYINKNF